MREDQPLLPTQKNKPLKELTDEDLIHLMQKVSSDETGVVFSEIYMRYHDKILHYLYGFVYDYQIAEDLVQEIMVKLFHNYQSFRVAEKFSSWFYRIASNTAITYLKKMKKRESIASQVEFDAIEIDILDERLTDVFENIEQQEMATNLNKLIFQLPIKFRLVFILRLQEEKSYQEISAILHISERTAKWRMAKAIELMKNMLQAEGK